MATLPENVLNLLKNLTPSVVATAKENKPYTTFITWLIAKDEKTIRFAVNKDSLTANNIKENPYVSIEVFGDGIACSISGSAKVIKDEIETISFPVSVIEVNVENVVDNLFPGGTVTGEIPFKHTGDIEKAEDLDKKVLEALTE